MSGVADWNIVADMLFWTPSLVSINVCVCLLKRRLVVTCVCVEGAVLKDETLYVGLGSTDSSRERFVTDQGPSSSSYPHTFVLTCYESGMLNSSVNSQRINTANSLSGAAPLSCKPKGPAQGQRPARPLAGTCENNRI